MKSLTFTCITDIAEAEKAWRALSPEKVLYDDWDFRYSYYKYFNYPLFFIAGYDENQLIGVLPLMWDEKKKILDFFAGFGYMEDNQVFVREGYSEYIPQFVDQIKTLIKKPALLEYMHESMNVQDAKVHDYNYFIKLENFKNYEDFMNVYLSSHTRKNLVWQMKKIKSHDIQISYDDVNDLRILGEFSKMRFGHTSSFNERPHWEEFFMEIAKKFQSKIITVLIDGKKEGIGFVLFYKNICYGINAGYNPEIKNLGKYLTLLKIDAAIQAGMEIYDAGGSGAFGWKEDFNLFKRPFYLIEMT